MTRSPHSTPGPKTYPVVKDPRPEAIVVHCSDPRLQTAFAAFIRDELGLGAGQVIPIVVGGGAGVMAHPDNMPREFRFVRDRLEHYCRKAFPSVRRIVLINHQECRYYQHLKEKGLGFLRTQELMADRPQEDLAAVAKAFSMWLADLHVPLELYYARFADADHARLTFERIEV